MKNSEENTKIDSLYQDYVKERAADTLNNESLLFLDNRLSLVGITDKDGNLFLVVGSHCK